MKYAYSLTALLFIGMSVTAFSHPHFSKSLKATLPSKVEASVSYYTVPANMSHIEKIKVGGFVPQPRHFVSVRCRFVRVHLGFSRRVHHWCY